MKKYIWHQRRSLVSDYVYYHEPGYIDIHSQGCINISGIIWSPYKQKLPTTSEWNYWNFYIFSCKYHNDVYMQLCIYLNLIGKYSS